MIIDLSEVSYMDSTGLGVFVGVFKSLRANEGNLILTGMSDRLKRLFDITGLAEVMDISTRSRGWGMMGKAYDYIEMKIPAKTEYVGVIRLNCIWNCKPNGLYI